MHLCHDRSEGQEREIRAPDLYTCAMEVRTVSAPESGDLTPHGKRIFPRLRASLPVRFGLGYREAAGCTANISIRGMLIVSDSAPEPGQLLTIALTLPGGNEAQIHARVTYVAPTPFDPAYARAFAVELTRPSSELGAFVGLLVAAKARKRGF